MRNFTLDGHNFTAEDCLDGVLLNPELPNDFDSTPNDARPNSQSKWWNIPYIRTSSVEEWDSTYAARTDDHAEAGRAYWAEARAKWMEAWPTGVRYEVRCLDGGAWDRSTSWGMFSTLELAIACAQTGPTWRTT